MNTQSDIMAAASELRSDKFRLERESDWDRLDDIITKVEKGKAKRLTDDEVLELPTLYRTALSSLSIARENSLDAGLIAYLESLTLRTYFLVYGTQTTLAGWCKDFFGGGWSQAVRSMIPEIIVALVLMVAGTLVGYYMVDANTDWYYSLVGEGMAQGRVPGASRAELEATIFGQSEVEGMAQFAAFLFSNNAQVSILAFALGFAFALPTILLLIHNMALLGAMLWVFGSQGLTVDFVGWLAIHGTTEFFAILLAGAAGMHVGRTIAFPGNMSHLQAASAAGKRGALVMAGVVIMLIFAGILEGFARQMIDNTAGRYAVGGTMLAFWLGYFFLYRRKPA